jgi:hypothetical protein
MFNPGVRARGSSEDRKQIGTLHCALAECFLIIKNAGGLINGISVNLFGF